MRYNGWTNYETWLCALHLDNEQGDYERLRQRARELLEDGEKDDAIYALADEIKEELYEAADSFDMRGLLADLLNSALQEINWFEVAKRYFED